MAPPALGAALVRGKALAGAVARAFAVSQAGEMKQFAERHRGTANDGWVKIPVNWSSFITALEYDGGAKTIWVEITSKKGQVRRYWYDGKSWDFFRDFVEAFSAGGHYNAHVKGQFGDFKSVNDFLKRGKTQLRAAGVRAAGTARRFGAGLRTLR